jgi:hypothetical protein
MIKTYQISASFPNFVVIEAGVRQGRRCVACAKPHHFGKLRGRSSYLLSEPLRSNVRFGYACRRNFRFTPESGHVQCMPIAESRICEGQRSKGRP